MWLLWFLIGLVKPFLIHMKAKIFITQDLEMKAQQTFHLFRHFQYTEPGARLFSHPAQKLIIPIADEDRMKTLKTYPGILVN